MSLPAAPRVGLSFDEFLARNPCDGCPAPCCRMTTVPGTPPASYRDLDYLLYVLRFNETELVWSADGAWTLVRWATCTAMDEQSCRCTLHGTADKPVICRDFDAFSCWYRRVFVGDGDADALRLTFAHMDALKPYFAFDETGRITTVPDFEQARAIMQGLPSARRFTIDPALQK